MNLDECFAILERCAVKGERCPQNKPHGPIAGELSILARGGKIRIEVFRGNWRVVTILKGPHRGKQTKAPPQPHGDPYMIVDKRGRFASGAWYSHPGTEHSGPSAPRKFSWDGQ